MKRRISILCLLILLLDIPSSGNSAGMLYMPDGKTRVDEEFNGGRSLNGYKTYLFTKILKDFNQLICKDSIYIQVRFFPDKDAPFPYVLQYGNQYDDNDIFKDLKDVKYDMPDSNATVLKLYSYDPVIDFTKCILLLNWGIRHRNDIQTIKDIKFEGALDSLFQTAIIRQKLNNIYAKSDIALNCIWSKKYAVTNYVDKLNCYYQNKTWNIYDLNDTNRILLRLTNIFTIKTNGSDFVYFPDPHTFYFYSRDKRLFKGPIKYPDLLYSKYFNVNQILWRDSVVVLRRYDYDVIYNPRTNSVIEDTNSIDFNKLAGLIPIRENLHWQKWHKIEIAKHKRQAFILALLALFVNVFLIWRSRK